MGLHPTVVHFITDFDTGGAESFLTRLIINTSHEIRHRVVSLKGKGRAAQVVEGKGIEVLALRMSTPSFPKNAIGLSSFVQDADVVHTWLYHADLVGGLYGRLILRTPVIWSIRSLSPTRGLKPATRLVTRACARLSGLVPSVITVNSLKALEEHASFGYDRTKLLHIPNGFDTETFRPDRSKREHIRGGWGIKAATFAIGTVSRFSPAEKDYVTLLRAFAVFHSMHPDSALVIVGPGNVPENQAWHDIARRAGAEALLGKAIVLAGPRYDMVDVMNAFDMFTLASHVEGFPNVVGEAMACGVPVAGTDVGDTGYLIGDESLIFPRGEAGALVAIWDRVWHMAPNQRMELGMKGRSRIEELFDIRTIVRRYVELYRSLAR